MKRSTLITAAVLLAMVVFIIAALLIQTASGPTFRPGDHADLASCLRAIPAEWGPGSIERDGAEQSCRYVHDGTR